RPRRGLHPGDRSRAAVLGGGGSSQQPAGIARVRPAPGRCRGSLRARLRGEAGGIINIAEERSPTGYDHDRAFANVTRIYDTVLDVFDAAKQDGLTPVEAAEAIARRRLDAGVHQIRTFP